MRDYYEYMNTHRVEDNNQILTSPKKNGIKIFLCSTIQCSRLEIKSEKKKIKDQDT